MVSFDLHRIIDEHLLKTYQEDKAERPPRTVGNYYATEIGQCVRQAHIGFYEPKDTSVDTLRLFAAGKKYEEFVMEAVKDHPDIKFSFPQRDITVVVDPNPNDPVSVHGRTDLLIVAEKDNERVLYEIKSAKNINPIDAPHDTYMVQCTPYMIALQCKTIVPFYGDKRDYSDKQFEESMTPELFKNFVDRAMTLHKHVSTRTMPVAEAKMCRDCKAGYYSYDNKKKVYVCDACSKERIYGDTWLWKCNFCPASEACDKLEEQRKKMLK